MSVRAYRIKKIEYADTSFNLYHDTELMSILEESTQFYSHLNDNCSGFGEILDIEFDEVKENLEEVIDGLKTTKTNQPENKGKAKHYIEILTEMEKYIKKDGYILYNCF